MFKIVKPATEAERTTQTTLDTIEVTPNIVKSWKIPPFQRPLRVNEKVRALSRQIAADDGVIPGIITLGTKCLMSLSADSNFVDWLLGRLFNQRDISPCYGRLKTIFAKRLEADIGHKQNMPSPAWSTNATGK